MRVHIELAHTLDADEWAARHARGEVPDHWPYGLDHLREHGIEPTVRRPARRRWATRLDRRLRAVGGGVDWLDAVADAARAERRRCDAILCWSEQSSVPVLLRERSLPRGRPVMTGLIWATDPQLVTPRSLRLTQRAVTRARAVHVLSERQVAPLVDEWGLPRSRVHYIPFGIDAEFFAAASAAAIEPDLVVSAGNDRHRDHPALVAAVAEIRRRHGRGRLEIATRTPVDLPEWGHRHVGLDERSVRGLYARAGVVAIATTPNRHASGVTVALEAMASARAVVVADDSGLADYVTPGETGLLYRGGDHDSLVAALEQVLADPGAAAAMGAAARRRVEAEFTTRHQAGRIAAVLTAL